jgi:hypothetical protein
MSMALVNPALRRLTFTPAILDEARKCGYLAHHRHLQGQKRTRGNERPSFYLQLGNAAHEVAEKVCRLSTTGVDLKDPEALAAQYWNGSHFWTPEDALEGWYAVVPMVGNLIDFLKHENLSVIATEEFRQMPTARIEPYAMVTIRGRLDVVCRRLSDGTFVALDFKTSNHLPSADDLLMQPSTTVYRGLARQVVGTEEPVSVGQFMLRTGSAVIVDVTDVEVLATRRFIRDLAVATCDSSGADVSVFAPRKGGHCAYCPIQDGCPAWRTDDSGGELEL